jgi:hypothetical protein
LVLGTIIFLDERLKLRQTRCQYYSWLAILKGARVPPVAMDIK